MIKEKLKTLPLKPGCYLMKNKKGEVIYVGKAINLKNRVNSYFRGAHDYKTTKLVSNIFDFDYVVTKNEKEALILEYNLIKKYNPYFNIVFKDDKSYPYILLSNCYEPYLSVIRIKKNSKKVKGKLFGPYPDVGAARNTVSLLNKIYPLRKCEKLKNDYCLYYHIGECLGYCKNKIDENLINEYKTKVYKFLNGDNSEVLKNLNYLMKEASSKMEYEKAKEYRDLINDVKYSGVKQSVQINKNESFDVFNYDVEDGYICITALFIRNGKLLNTIKFLDYLIGDPENFVTSYIYQYYSINETSKFVYVPKELIGYLKDSIDNIEFKTVSRGNKYQLLKQAKINSSEYLKQNKKIITSKNNYQEMVSNEFKRIFNKDIKRIEIFDNSHTAGKQTVAGMVVYKDFKPCKSEYRLFKLEDSNDDLKSMHEVLYRRYFRVLKDNLEKPDLIIVDGSKTQIKIAKQVLNSLNLDIDVVGLGKDNHHNTSYLMNSNFEIINIEKNSNLFLVLTNMQDEVHRFAISYHKKLRSKATYNSLLDDVKGLGPKLRTKLLSKYKSISNIKTLTVDELNTVLPNQVAQRLYNKLQENIDD